MKQPKPTLAKMALAYIRHTPVARGKMRLAAMLHPLTAGAPVSFGFNTS